MARWSYRRLVWTERAPEGRDRERLAALFQVLDHDAPTTPESAYCVPPYELPGLGPWGLAAIWRKPLQPWPALLNVAHCWGYPCRGWEFFRIDRNAWLGPPPAGDPDWELWPGWQGWLAPTWPEPPAGCAWHESAPQLAGVGLLADDCARLARFSRRFGAYLPPQPRETRHSRGWRRDGGLRRPGRWERPFFRKV